jgi:hypothetical protein
LHLITPTPTHTHTHTHTHTVGSIPLDERPVRRRDVYLKTYTHERQTSMPPAEIEPAFAESERPRTHTLDRAATGIGYLKFNGHYLYHHMY